VQRHIAGLAALAGHFQVRHAAPPVPEVLHRQFAQLFAPQGMVEQGGQYGSVAFHAKRIPSGCIEQLPRLVVAQGRGAAVAAVRFWAFHALDGVVGDGVMVAQGVEQRGQGRQPVPDGRAVQGTVAEVVTPGDNVRPRHGAEFFWFLDARERHEVLDGVFISQPCIGVSEIGEPFHFRRHVGQAQEFRRGQQAAWGRGGRQGFHGRILLLIKYVIKSKHMASRKNDPLNLNLYCHTE